MARDDDDVWKAIVENYGDRADLDPEPLPEAAPEPVAAEPTRASWDDEHPDSDWSSDRFVPPPPPPLPTLTPERYAAWGGVFGSPAILLVCLVFRVDLPQLVAYLLVVGFVGGFLYLVFTMTREPRDPGDDGAVL